MKYLVTGAAGFIGAHVANALLARGDRVVGLDNLNDYYDVGLKEDRLTSLLDHSDFSFERLDISNKAGLETLLNTYRPDRIIHMAAQAGVRYSLENPQAYVDTNISGFLNLLEGVRNTGCQHLVYASSSSVYGDNRKQPYSEDDKADCPVSLYGATKKSNELMAYAYAHLFRIPCTGLRFFTVYGPWGRPDMAPMKFLRKILAGEPIDVYNGGKHRRDFTYIDDVVEGVLRVADHPPAGGSALSNGERAAQAVPHEIYNIGNQQPVQLDDFITLLEAAVGLPAARNLLPMQPGDVEDTYADVSALERDVGYHPSTSIEEGVRALVAWYRSYYYVNPGVEQIS